MRYLKSILITCAAVGIFVPIVDVVVNYINNKPIGIGSFFLDIIISVIVAFFITTSNLYVFKYIWRRYPERSQFGKRILRELFGAALIASIVISVIYLPLKWISDSTGIDYNKEDMSYLKLLFFVNVINLIVSLFFEAYYQFTRWKELLVETEKMKRENVESQYAALKNQVNPHFLFNSLNTLSSLIRVSPDKALEYVDKFSKIYRYVLDMSDKMIIELREELSFLQSYYYLQKLRFGDNLNIDIEIPAESLNEYVLPLSLQILIENVVKHNEISSERPMKIFIGTANGFLMVSNSLQLKMNVENTTGIGLTNLKERYLHITDTAPEFYATSDQYIAKIPLIKELE
jgi:two-component system, LytTR family, sensor kinase